VLISHSGGSFVLEGFTLDTKPEVSDLKEIKCHNQTCPTDIIQNLLEIKGVFQLTVPPKETGFRFRQTSKTPQRHI